MHVKNLVLLAMGVAEAQVDSSTAGPELTVTQYESMFEVNFDGAENEPDQVVEREVFRTSDGNERESKRNRSARRQIEKELKQREAEEAAQAAALGYDPRQTRLGGFRGGPFRGMPTTSFGGRGGRGPVLGAGGRLGGFGPGPLSMGPGSEPSEPDEENEPTTTLEPTTLTKAEPTTEPSSLFSELKDAPPPTTDAPITTRTQKKFWEKKNPTKLVQTPFHERSRERFIDTITNTMGIAPRGSQSNRCLECKNAPDPASCLSEGNVKQCTKNEACQTEIRWENGKVRIESFCKQKNACQVMLSQNAQCNRLKGKKANRTCWKCCTGDLCNIADMAPNNF